MWKIQWSLVYAGSPDATEPFFFYYEIYIFAKFQSVIKHYSQVFIGLDNVNTYALNDCWCVSTVLQSDTHHFL